jgi:interferon gamma-inducible protein 30
LQIFQQHPLQVIVNQYNFHEGTYEPHHITMLPEIHQTVATAPPVLVQAYTESLCIDCKNFIDHQLVHTYRELGPKVINLQIVPFGNADIDEGSQSVECQHGDAECDANSWEQCAVVKYHPTDYIDFIGCLETSLPMGTRGMPFDEDYFQACSDLSFLEFDYLKSCHDNPMQAWMLQKKFAKLTPEHDHVPWVLIDGIFFDEEKQDLRREVCNAYVGKGGSHPKCSEILKLN